MARYLKKPKRPKWIRKVLIFCISVAAVAGAAIGGLYAYTHIDDGMILENIHVAGVNVGGMTKDEAAAAVLSATQDTYTKQSFSIKVASETYTITPEDSNASLDVTGAVNAAYLYGRDGFAFKRLQQQKAAENAPFHLDILPYLNLNCEAIQNQVDQLQDTYNVAAIDHSYRLEGTMPADPDDSSADRALILTVGKPGYSLDTTTLYDQILAGYNTNDLQLKTDCQVIDPATPDFDALIAENCIAPVDAVLNAEGTVASEHKNGYGFTKLEAINALLNSEPGEEVKINFHVLEPKVTKFDLEAGMFKDLLSEYTAKYGSNYNRDVNLKLSTAAVNGTILQPGEVFDYNSTLGERTPEAGYKLGNTYAGMETIQTYGGGICQTSSTLYYCALMADLEIVTRINHGFISDYVPYGMDATVSWGGPEFRFKNSTKYPIKIEAFSEGGNVTVRLWGTDDKDYYVKMEYEVLGVYSWKKVTQEMYADNAKGYKDGQVITSPYTGYKIQTYRCKYSKANDALISKEPEALSVYDTRNQVVCKIIEKPSAEPTDPTTPSTPGTDPSTPPEETTPPDPSTPPPMPPVTEDGA